MKDTVVMEQLNYRTFDYVFLLINVLSCDYYVLFFVCLAVHPNGFVQPYIPSKCILFVKLLYILQDHQGIFRNLVELIGITSIMEVDT